uniref:Uncharacterized protein n=1 Tax=Amphimedon queenslandica TaxID=400682 RepID=A0A1X7UJL7_AMPQE
MVDGYLQIHLPYHLDIVRFCFGRLIQKELDQFVFEWNSHRIRPNWMANSPAGVPNDLYHLPFLNGACDHALPISNCILDAIEAEFECREGSLVSDEQIRRSYSNSLQQTTTR